MPHRPLIALIDKIRDWVVATLRPHHHDPYGPEPLYRGAVVSTTRGRVMPGHRQKRINAANRLRYPVS